MQRPLGGLSEAKADIEEDLALIAGEKDKEKYANLREASVIRMARYVGRLEQRLEDLERQVR